MAKTERLSQRPRTECKDNNLAVIVHLNFNKKIPPKRKLMEPHTPDQNRF
jgi:hypothetical protein